MHGEPELSPPGSRSGLGLEEGVGLRGGTRLGSSATRESAAWLTLALLALIGAIEKSNL